MGIAEFFNPLPPPVVVSIKNNEDMYNFGVAVAETIFIPRLLQNKNIGVWEYGLPDSGKKEFFIAAKAAFVINEHRDLKNGWSGLSFLHFSDFCYPFNIGQADIAVLFSHPKAETNLYRYRMNKPYFSKAIRAFQDYRDDRAPSPSEKNRIATLLKELRASAGDASLSIPYEVNEHVVRIVLLSEDSEMKKLFVSAHKILSERFTPPLPDVPKTDPRQNQDARQILAA